MSYISKIPSAGRGGVLKSIGDMGAVMTNMVLGTSGMTKQVSATMQKKSSITCAEDTLVMDTKLKIIEILQVSLKTPFYCDYSNEYIEVAFL